MRQEQTDGYEFDVQENLHTVFIRKDGDIVGAVRPTQLKRLGLIEEEEE